MSTILKALRESEARRATGPRFHESAPGHGTVARRRRRHGFAIALLLAAAGLAAAWWRFGGGGDPAVGGAGPRQARVAQVSLPPRPAQGVGEPAQKPGVRAQGEGAEAAPAPEPERSRPPQGTATPASAHATPEPASGAESSTATARTGQRTEQHLDRYALLPRWRDLSPERRARLPQLALNAHVYAEDSRDRFVLINLERFAEGDTVATGVRVAAIFPGGVVLEDAGGQFVLPRP